MLRSNRVNYWTGKEGREFEREFAQWVGTRHAVALMNGTVALDVALKALGIGAGRRGGRHAAQLHRFGLLRGERGRDPGVR